MIKILTNLLPFKNTCIAGSFRFATNKNDNKSTEIVNNFTNKILEQNREKVVTRGRSWKASELRIKSTQDLHKLWFVCVRQKNVILADQMAMEHDRTYQRKAGKITQLDKIKQTMSRILFVINQREQIKKDYRKQLQLEYIENKKAQLEKTVQEQPEPLPEITFEMLRSKYHALRKGVDNVSYLERIFRQKEEAAARNQRAEQRVSELDPEKEFDSFWKYEITIGERPTQTQILKTHIKNWKALNLKQRKIILGFLNARRSKEAKEQFRKQLKILGQKLAFQEAKNRISTPTN